MPSFYTVAQAGRYIWGNHSFGFRDNPPADEHVNFFRAVLTIANADGVVSSKEKTYAKAAAMMNCMSLKDFEDLAAATPPGDSDYAAEQVYKELETTPILKLHGRRASLYYASLVAAQDGMDAAERKAVFAVANKIGIPLNEVERCIQCAVKEAELLQEKKNTLFPNGSKYHVKPVMDFQSIEEACRGYWAHITFGMTEVPPVELTTAMIKASLSVAVADGVLSSDEKNTALAAAIVTGLSQKDFDEFLSELNASTDKTQIAIDSLSKLPKEFQLAALYYACFVAAVDGFVPSEMEAIKKVGSALELDSNAVSKVISLGVREKALHDERVDATFPGDKIYKQN